MSSRPPASDDPIRAALDSDDAALEADALVERLRSSLEDRPDVALAGVRAPRSAEAGPAIAPLEPPTTPTDTPMRLARLLARRRVLCVEPDRGDGEIAFSQLARAAAACEGTALVRVATADEGLARLAEGSTAGEPFDLAITHWGEGAAYDARGARRSAAEHLLAGVRARDLRCPVVVFAAAAPAEAAERRKRTALGLGAQAYCIAFEMLYQAIERVLAPAAETG